MTAEIHTLGDPATHFWLTRSVARVMGVSLSQAMANGDLSARDYGEMITTCRTCPHVAQCQAWLGTPRDGVADAPDHCLNRRVMTRLASGRPA